MAVFNATLLKTTWEKILNGEQMIVNLEMINQSDVPLNLAIELQMESKLAKWVPYGSMGALCNEIISKLKTKREEEKKKQEKKETRKRKAQETKDLKAKKAKTTQSEEKENSERLIEESAQTEPKKKELKKVAPKKVFAPLFKKCMRDRRNFRF